MAEFYNSRAARLAPDQAVLFIFNYENNTNINAFEVDVGRPEGVDSNGRTVVTLKGRGEVGPNGHGGYIGEVKFGYRRTPLSSLGLLDYGNFFDNMGKEPTFLNIVQEVYRLTQITLTREDFVDTPYDATLDSGYILQANPLSWRFEGQINLGQPTRRDLDQYLDIPQESQPLDLFEENSDEVEKRLTYRYTNLDLTPYPVFVGRLSVGKVFRLGDSDIVAALNQQFGRGSLVFTLNAVPKDDLNLYDARVVYNGPVRELDRRPYLSSQTHVVILRPSESYVDGAVGDIYLHYEPAAVMGVDNNSYSPLFITPLSTTTVGSRDYWANLALNSLISSANLAATSAAFLDTFGLNYEQRFGQAMRVVYVGPVRLTDALPDDTPGWRVTVVESDNHPLKPVIGTMKVYYK